MDENCQCGGTCADPTCERSPLPKQSQPDGAYAEGGCGCGGELPGGAFPPFARYLIGDLRHASPAERLSAASQEFAKTRHNQLVLTNQVADMRRQRDTVYTVLRLLLTKIGVLPECCSDDTLIHVARNFLHDDSTCGLCGKPGADKVAHPVRWPGECGPGKNRYVHAECENKECQRAFDALTPEQRADFIKSI